MLSLPTDGITRSTEKHNCDLMVAVDWLELVSLLSDGSQFSQSDVIDILEEGDIYADQGFAAEFVESMWAEMRRRGRCLDQAYPFTIGADHVELATQPAPSGLLFCLIASVGPRYSGWSRRFVGDYNEQGEYFELLVADALGHWFPRWSVQRTGWADGNRLTLEQLVNLIAGASNEDLNSDWRNWVPEGAKDLGVDVAVTRQFGDHAGGIPVMMWQCASGKNWTTKLSTPDTKAWSRIVTLTHTPMKGLGIPIVIAPEHFRARRNQAHGVLLDRCRLLPAVAESEWLSPTTLAAVERWNDSRIGWLRAQYALQ